MYYEVDGYEEFNVAVRPNVKKRLEEVNIIMNYIFKEQNIHELFEDQDVYVNY